MAAAPFMLTAIQMGLEGTPGTLVPATYKWTGNGTIKFDDNINPVGFEYAQGLAGGVIENTFIGDAGSTLTLSDTELTAMSAAWLFNMGIKAVTTSATADNSMTFAFPTTAANTISTFTWEVATKAQEYEFGYGICERFSIHGDVASNNGRIMHNAVIKGRASAASTLTGSLTPLADILPINMNASSIRFDAAGTAAGSASATSNFLRAFNVDVVTGWELRRYADGRAAKDGSVAVYKNYEITGMIRADLDSAVVTRIANARAGTPEIVQLTLNGASSTFVALKLPLSWTEIGELNNNDDGVITMELSFRSGYSTTSTAQGPAFVCTLTGDTTIT